MCPYSAFGVFKMDRVSNRLTSLRRRLTTTAGTDGVGGHHGVDAAIGGVGHARTRRARRRRRGASSPR